MAGFEKITASELREELVNIHGYTVEQAADITGKSKLVYEVVTQRQSKTHVVGVDVAETTQTSEDFDTNQVHPGESFEAFEAPEEDPHARLQPDVTEMFDDTEFEEEEIDVSSEEEEFTLPSYGTKAWQDFIMSELREDEIYKKNPLNFGLRRLTERYLGDIVSSGPVDVQVSNDINHPGRATVTYEIVILWKLGTPEYVGIDHTFGKRVFRAVAECWTGNSPATFSVHPAATAETKAASRAFKTALMLNIHTADEMSNDKDPVLVVSEAEEALFGRQNDWKSSMEISSTMKAFIVDRCSELNIDVDKFMNIAHYVYKTPEEQKTSEPQYTELDQVSKEVGRLMITEINKYQSDTGTSESKEIPPVLLLEN